MAVFSLHRGATVLTISDHLDWDEESEHLLMLQEKLNTYLRFVESGELLEAYADAANRKVVIDLVFRVAPPRRRKQFIEEVEPILNGAGIEFRSRVASAGTGGRRRRLLLADAPHELK